MIQAQQIINSIENVLEDKPSMSRYQNGVSRIIDVGGVKLLIREFGPDVLLHTYTKEELETHLVKDIKKMIRAVAKKELSVVLQRMNVAFLPPEEGNPTPGGYASLFDVIDIFPDAYFYQKSFLYTLLHEAGHRYWYKFMDRDKRKEWIDYIRGTTDVLTEEEASEIEEILVKAWDKAVQLYPDNPAIPLESIYAQMVAMIQDLSEVTASKLAFFFFHLQNPELFPYSDMNITVQKKQKRAAIADFMTDIKRFKFWQPGVSWYSNRNPAEAWAEVFWRYCSDAAVPASVRREFRLLCGIAPKKQKAEPGTEGYESLKKAITEILKKIKSASKWLTRQGKREIYGTLPVSGPSSQPSLYSS